MFKILRKTIIAFVVMLLCTQSFSNNLVELVGKAKAVNDAEINVLVSNYTWNTIGLRQNDVSTGPNQFLVQGRITSTAGNALGVTATASISGSQYVTLLSNGPQQVGDIPFGEYRDVFFNIVVERNQLAFNTSATVVITADGTNTSPDSGQRTLTVEGLQKQDRNKIISSVYSNNNPVVGDTFQLTLLSETSSCPNIENIATYPAYDPNILQLLSVEITYNYGDSANNNCPTSTENDIWAQGKGNVIKSILTFRALTVGTSPMFYLILDQSGESYHYNDDYGSLSPITISPQLSIQKSVDKTNANPGDELTYTLNYTNSGNGPASGVIVSDALDSAGQDFVNYIPGSGGNYNPVNKTVSFNINNLGGGESGSVSFKVKIADDIPLGNTTIKNIASIVSMETASLSSNEVSTIVNANVDLTLEKIDSPDPVQAGGEINYTLNYANIGNSIAHNVVLSDDVPQNTTFISATGGGSEASGTITWNLGDLSPNSNGTVTFKVYVDKVLDSGTKINNEAKISSDEDGPIYAQAQTTVESAPVFALIKTDTPDPVKAGNVITYTISYGNIGNMNATDVTISDPIPSGTTYVPFSATAGGVFDGQKVVWNLGTLKVGTNDSVSFSVMTDSNLSNDSIITNRVDLVSFQGSIFDEEQTTVVKPILETYKEVNYTEADPGDVLQYQIHFRNAGGIKATGVVISDIVDSNLENIIAQNGFVVLNTISWTIGDLEPSQNWQTVSFTAQIKSPLDDGTIILNSGLIESDDGDVPTNTVETVVDSAPDINIVKVSSPSGNIEPDTDITYTLTVTNTGNENASNVKLVDHWQFSSDIVATYVNGSSTPAADEIDLMNNNISWNLDNVIVGVPQTFTYKLHTSTTNVNSGSFDIKNRACLSKEDNALEYREFGDGICSDDVINTVTYQPELTIDKTVDTLKAKPGDEVMYTIVVTNTGNATANNITIEDTMNDNLIYIVDSSKLDNIDIANPNLFGNKYVWQVNNLGANESLILTYRAKIAFDTKSGTYENIAVAKAENTEDSPEDSASIIVYKPIIPQILGATTGPVIPATLPQTGADIAFSLITLISLLGISALINIFIWKLNKR